MRIFSTLRAIFLINIILSNVVVFAYAEEKTNRILVLNSYHRSYRWTDELMEGFLSSFDLDNPNLDIRIEFMDTKKSSSEDYLRKLTEIYHLKYKDIKFDVIIVTDNAALELIREKRSSLSAGSPIVFCGIDHSLDSLISGMTNITGILEDYDLKHTLNLALSLHPKTETIAVVNDCSTIGISDLARFREIKDQYKKNYTIKEIDNWNAQELVSELQALPENSLVLRLAFSETRDGVYFGDEEAAEIWEKYCKYPTYTSLGHKVTSGVLGGVLNVGQLHGKLLADYAKKIVGGMAADSIPITPHSPTKPVFDYMVMQKFGLEEASLPQSSILLNKPFSFYNTYKLFIWFGFVVVFILIILVLILFINVIKRRAAQKTLIENERKYRTLVETVPQGIIEVDKDLIITFANSALRKNFDLWDLDLIGKSIYKFISSDQAEILRNRFSNILEQRVNFPQYSGSYRTIKGKSLYVQLDWSYKRNADGNIVGFISVVSDITQRIKAEKEAKIRQEQLIQADKMVALGTLVSGMAHEINNPNNFILINIPILRKVWKSVLPILDSYFQKNNDFYVARFPYKVIREDYFEICSNILAGTNRIKSIVNDLKEYSRKDVGELIENIAINNVVTSCINLLGNNINKYTNHLHLDLAKKLPAVRGNFRHFEQILINLIQNACQSLRSKTDPVSIKTCLQNGRVEIHIIDKGIGISKENISRIFDPFYTTKRNEGGTGLGLSVSNSLVQKYEGELRFNSIENDGTTAVVSFPAINKVTE